MAHPPLKEFGNKFNWKESLVMVPPILKQHPEAQYLIVDTTIDAISQPGVVDNWCWFQF